MEKDSIIRDEFIEGALFPITWGRLGLGWEKPFNRINLHLDCGTEKKRFEYDKMSFYKRKNK